MFYTKLMNSTLGTLATKPVYCSTCFVSTSPSSGSFLANNLRTLTVKINLLLEKNAFNNDNHLRRIMSILCIEMFTLPKDRNTKHFEFAN